MGVIKEVLIALKSIKKTHTRVPKGGIYKLIYFWYWEGILWASFVQAHEVHTHHHFLVFFFTTTMLANHSK